MTTNVCDILLNDIYIYFIRALYEYKTDDKTISKICLSKCLKHMN